MIVLRAIGNFFVRIWRWIKETAWVQPLLIVGIIFGVIFSIPSIVNGIKGLNEKAASSETFYRQFQYSLRSSENSKADRVTKYVYEMSKVDSGDATKISEVKNKYSDIANDLGDKFFFTFVAQTCSTCDEAKGGFEVLKDNFKGSFKPKDERDFKMVTIFIDEVTEETTATDASYAFRKYLDRNDEFFEYAAGVGYNTDYFTNGKVQETDLRDIEAIDPTTFPTPTIMLIDLTAEATSYVGSMGVREIFFNATADSDYKKAELLLSAWNHTNDFSINGEK